MSLECFLKSKSRKSWEVTFPSFDVFGQEGSYPNLKKGAHSCMLKPEELSLFIVFCLGCFFLNKKKLLGNIELK